MEFQLNIDFQIDPELNRKSLNQVKLNIKKAIRRYGMSLSKADPCHNKNILDINVYKMSDDSHLQRSE